MRLALMSISTALAIGFAAFFGPAVTPAAAAEWCAVFEEDGNLDCSYYTFQECQRAISGVGGDCQQNLRPSSNEPQPSPVLPLPRIFRGDHPARDYDVPPPPGMDPPPPYPEPPSDERYAPAPPGYPPPPAPYPR